MKLYGFPGQGSQFPGMGKDLYESNALAKELFDKADAILGFSLTDIMFNGSAEDLLQTRVTQPAVFVHSVVAALCLGDDFRPDMVAGHSLGEFSALAASGALSFEDGLKLVYARALAMQECCERQPGTMAAVIGLPDAEIERVCAEVAAETGKVLDAANYNSPGNVAISGAKEAIEAAVPKMKEAGAKHCLPLQVGGAFHSPLMEPARVELASAIASVQFSKAKCPVYQNVTALPSTDPELIRENLLKQLTSPVRWTQSVRNMLSDGADHFVEFGPGNVLQGLIAKIAKGVEGIVIEGVSSVL